MDYWVELLAEKQRLLGQLKSLTLPTLTVEHHSIPELLGRISELTRDNVGLTRECARLRAEVASLTEVKAAVPSDQRSTGIPSNALQDRVTGGMGGL